MKNPEESIKYVKNFISELTVIQNTYFDGLCEGLGLTEEGRDWMFDYVFNNAPGSNTFEEYLKGYEKTFGEMK
jgi:hypothetical protein